MRKTISFIFIIIFAGVVPAQSIGQWKIYSDMKNTKSAAVSINGVWAVTDGGAFMFKTSDSTYYKLTKADGLNSQALSAIGVDKNNKIWFGSQDGYLIVYDEKKETIKNILDIFKSDKSQKQINNIFVSGDTVLVSTDFGLSLINISNYSFFDTFLKLGEFPAESKVLNAYKSSLIYVCTESGIAVQKQGTTNLSAPESWDVYRFNSNIQAQKGTKILKYNGQILLATNNGIFAFVNKSWQQFIMQGNPINDMFVFGNNLYIITNTQLFNYTGNQLSVLYQNSNLKFNNVFVKDNNTIYIPSSGGLIELKNNKARILYPEGPYSNLFINLATDSQGKVYVATGKDVFGVGFLEFNGKDWKRYSKENNLQLPSNSYHNVYVDPANTVYLSNWGKGFTIFKDGQFQVYTAANSGLVGIPVDTSFLAIADVKTDSKGNIWIANHQSAARKPLSVLTPQKKWYHFSFTNPYLSEYDLLDKMVIDQFDNKWFVVMDGNRGLYYFNETQTFENLSDDKQGYIGASDGLISDLIAALAVDKRGQLWIGTSKGINVITDPSRPKTTLTSSYGLALRNQTVTCIAVDPLDQKWIGTKQGVFVLSVDGMLANYYNSKNSAIPNDDIKSIAVDASSGKVYIGTDYGLAMLQTASIQPSESFNELFIYPNPLILVDGNDNNVNIEGLVKNSSIKIFDIGGNLIRSFKSPGGKIAFWDGRDLNGSLVSTGIYIIVAYDDEANNVATSKVAVIKK